MSSLKSFIKSVRAAKTIADERAVIQKESAAIRTSFREDYSDQNVRRQNVAKLLYLFTLGERTAFGQVECLKLLATNRFSDKRLGYLGTMLLLDENQETLTLLTNSLSNDLASPNQYIVALALCTLGNISGTEMSRDLFADVEKILSSSNPYLKKKAALCAMRIMRKVPDLSEVYLDKAKLLLSDRNHGVLLSGTALAYDMCLQDESNIAQFRPLLPSLVNLLKGLASSGYAPEHDVTGVADPFLQVNILKLMRVLAAGDAESSELLSDILAQILSNTDGSKNVGNAVLYEAVRTIFGIEAESGLRVLGISVLGKFLGKKDNNTRYVALNTLLTVIDMEPTAVQRHRVTIVECLQDSDISIRRRALELSYALINEQNIRVLIRELLTFLETADVEFKSNLVSQIAVAAEKYAPNKRWHMDTIVRVLKLAGNYVKENVLSAFITLVITSTDLQLYAVQKLYAALRADITQEGLTLAGSWLIGEYGNVLVGGGSFEDEELSLSVSETEVVNLLHTILQSSYATDPVKEYVINALVKLSVRFQAPEEVERIRRIIQSYSTSLNIEVQQRAIEYDQLFANTSIRRGVLEAMPPPEVKEDLNKKYDKSGRQIVDRPVAKRAVKSNAVDLLLDLQDDDSLPTQAVPAQQQSAVDLLSDIFGGASVSSNPVATTKPAANNNSSILDLFDSTPAASAPAASAPAASAPAAPAAQVFTAYSQKSLSIGFSRDAQSPSGSALLLVEFKNTSTSDNISDLNLQVAVPKGQKLQLQAISSTTLAPGASASQKLTVSGSPGSNLRLRLRIVYSVNGTQVKEQVDFSKIPEPL